jgi:hypothetical protein
MLDAATKGKMAAAFSTAIVTLGSPMQWQEALPPNRTATITAGFRAVNRDDLSIVNAYGVETKVITVRAQDLPQAPAQFDAFIINGERYVVQASHQVHLNDLLVGHRCYCKGV